MATATTSRHKITDAQVLKALGRSRKGKTAAEVGVPASRLRSIEGVEEVGVRKTGKAGRPSVLFARVQNTEQESE